MSKVIAECGVAHNGSYKVASDMAKAALDAGADYVKFQYFDPYLSARRLNDPKQLTYPCSLSMDDPQAVCHSDDLWRMLLDEIPREKRMLTVEEPAGVIKATLWKVDNLKIGHREVCNSKLINLCCLLAETVFLSLPFSQAEVYDKRWPVRTLLTVPSYPASKEDVATCIALCHKMGVGYSDHSGRDIAAALDAIEADAPIVEVHVRMDENHKCVDEAVSKTMKQLETLCKEAHR